MRSLNRVLVLVLVLVTFAAPAALLAGDAVPGKPIATKGKLLFSDDFTDAGSLENWKTVVPAFAVKDGVLVGTQARDDHGAVGRVSVPMKDLIAEFKFQLAGSPTFNVVFDDKNHKGTHAGHICRVAVTPTQIRLGDDKEGVMRNDIFEMRKDPKRKAEAEKLLEGRGATFKTTVAPNQWHTMTIEIAGDAMRVSLDGKAVGSLQSPGLAHPTKESLHFTVNGSDALFDDVRIWAAEPARKVQGTSG